MDKTEEFDRICDAATGMKIYMSLRTSEAGEAISYTEVGDRTQGASSTAVAALPRDDTTELFSQEPDKPGGTPIGRLSQQQDRIFFKWR
jgi:hypothetical protein